MDPNGPLYWHNFVFDEQSDQFVFYIAIWFNNGGLTNANQHRNKSNKQIMVHKYMCWCLQLWWSSLRGSWKCILFLCKQLQVGSRNKIYMKTWTGWIFFLSYGKAPCYLVAGTSFCSNTILHECKKSQACSRWVGSAQKKQITTTWICTDTWCFNLTTNIYTKHRWLYTIDNVTFHFTIIPREKTTMPTTFLQPKKEQLELEHCTEENFVKTNHLNPDPPHEPQEASGLTIELLHLEKKTQEKTGTGEFWFTKSCGVFLPRFALFTRLLCSTASVFLDLWPPISWKI